MAVKCLDYPKSSIATRPAPNTFLCSHNLKPSHFAARRPESPCTPLPRNLGSDLTDIPLHDPDISMFSDGSSFVFQGQRYAGAAVTTDREVLWQQTLPPGTSAQCAELIALTKALKLRRNKSVNIYTDSRYAFATTHVHGSIYQECGLLTAEGKAIKNKSEILDLLAAIWEPERLAIIHCPGHQKGDSLQAIGNRLADAAARESCPN